MFGALLMGYFFYKARYPEAFLIGSQFLDWKLGSLNTVILLLSSFTMALSIYYAQNNQFKKV